MGTDERFFERHGGAFGAPEGMPAADREAVRGALVAEAAGPVSAPASGWRSGLLAAAATVAGLCMAAGSTLVGPRSGVGAAPPAYDLRACAMDAHPAFAAVMSLESATVTLGAPVVLMDEPTEELKETMLFMGERLAATRSAGRQAFAPYTVHEWGVVMLDPRGVAITALGLAADLPGFVGRAEGAAVAPRIEDLDGAVTSLKPILYFYPGPDAMPGLTVDCEVRLPGGRPMFFWPPAVLTSPAEGTVADGVRWEGLRIGPAPEGEEAAAPPREVAPGHWFHDARNVDAATVSAGGESERFAFYDGEIRYASPFLQDLEGDRLVLTNASDEPVRDLWVIRRESGALSVARRAALEPGAAWETDLSLMEGAHPLAQEEALAAVLEGAGLFAKEARGMARIWREDFFGRDGRWLLWRIPSGALERAQPLTFDPLPSSDPVRVHLAFSPLVPGLAARVRALVEGLGDPAFAAREETMRTLIEVGPIAAPHLRAYREHPDPETAARVAQILEMWGG